MKNSWAKWWLVNLTLKETHYFPTLSIHDLFLWSKHHQTVHSQSVMICLEKFIAEISFGMLNQLTWSNLVNYNHVQHQAAPGWPVDWYYWISNANYYQNKNQIWQAKYQHFTHSMQSINILFLSAYSYA